MDKTTTISLGGQIFSIDSDAYSILSRYLNHVAAKFSSEPDADETLFDIESRIAEIFGGGQEPPILISESMVNNMISIMGAPEEYYEDQAANTNEDTEKTGWTGQRKEMYNPNSPAAATGKALSSFFKALGSFFYGIFRFCAIVIGFCLTVSTVLVISSIIAVAFFPESALLTIDIFNISGLLTNVLGTEEIWQYVLMAAIVVFLPLLAIANVGLYLMFRINRVSKELSMALFIIWIVAVCVLSFSIVSIFPGFDYNGRTVKNFSIAEPIDTLYIKTLNSININDIDYASIDDFIIWKDQQTGEIYGNPRIESYASKDNSEIIYRKFLFEDNRGVNRTNFNALEYNVDLRGDTLFLDDYFTYNGTGRWDGAMVEIVLRLPEGTILKPVEMTTFSVVKIDNHISDAYCYEVKGYGLNPIFKNR